MTCRIFKLGSDGAAACLWDY